MPPRPTGLGLVIEDDEIQLRAPKEVPGRQTRLPTADHDNVPGLGHHDLHPPESNSPAPCAARHRSQRDGKLAIELAFLSRWMSS